MPSELSTLWTLSINGGAHATFAALGLDDGTLTIVNQQADTLDLVQALPSAVTAASAFVNGATVELARDGVVWFRGKVRAGSVDVQRSRSIHVRGAWDVLERRAYLQNFKVADDASDPDSTLGTISRGRVVLGQNDDGEKIDLTEFLASVITYAGLTPGDIDVPLAVPFEDVTDLSCAEVVQRCLRWVPNTVVWFDYTTTPATCHMRQIADLDAETLTIGGTEEEPASIVRVVVTPRHDLVVNHVRLIYLATNRTNSASWETATDDVYPPGTTGEEDGALVRTIQLGGSTADRTELTQEVEVATIPTALNFGGYITAASNPTAFSTLSTFWKDHVTALKSGYITIRRFEAGKHTQADGVTAITAGLKELVEGALTDWMQEDDADIITEKQTATVTVYYEVTDPTDATKKSMHHAEHVIDLIATNATSKTYRQLASSSTTAAEAVPEGLAEALHAALSPLPYDGDVVIEEQVATLRPSVGALLNVAGDAAEYATMAALIQRRVVEIRAGRTTITVGPAKQLGPADRAEIYRTNRTRQPSTAYRVRATGKTGGGEGVDAPLPKYQPIRPSQTATVRPPRIFTQALSVAGTVPAGSEIKTAIEAAYTSAGVVPVLGDTLNLTVSSAVKLRTQVQFQGTAESWKVVQFTVDSTNYYGFQTPTGIW